jgi:hypothetical protein
MALSAEIDRGLRAAEKLEEADVLFRRLSLELVGDVRVYVQALTRRHADHCAARQKVLRTALAVEAVAYSAGITTPGKLYGWPQPGPCGGEGDEIVMADMVGTD